MRHNDIHTSQNNKKEILFLPYKASMWDSLESIWRAAKADVNCNVYVVVIPYCDKNPDASPAGWHFEKDLFPQEVDITDFRDYSLDEHHPDVIYIHNAYDGDNFVTSVDEQFYTAKLKKCTRRLVYVPYFMVGGSWPVMHAHLPAYNNLDYIVVQKKGLLVHSVEGDRVLEDFVSASKLLPLGSPKIDRIFLCEKHRAIPLAWGERIFGKKVFLYNLSISSLLHYGQSALKKMQYVFSCFAKRKDVVLLWRPHPLLEASLQAVHPDLLADYLRIKSDFVKNDMGILDGTPDIDMSVAIADAYIGEASSSVPQLFGVAGKPIFFLQEMTLWEKASEEEASLVRIGSVMGNAFPGKPLREIRFFASGWNMVCRYDIETEKITPECHLRETNQYSGMLYQNGKLYLSPNQAQEIRIYDFAAGVWTQVPIENPLQRENFGEII